MECDDSLTHSPEMENGLVSLAFQCSSVRGKRRFLRKWGWEGRAAVRDRDDFPPDMGHDVVFFSSTDQPAPYIEGKREKNLDSSRGHSQDCALKRTAMLLAEKYRL